MRTIKLALYGLGTVGSGVARILAKHNEDFKRRSGVSFEIAYVVGRNKARAEVLGLEDIFTTDIKKPINDPEVDIIVELMGGTTTARDVVLSALKAKKPVVTANKALIASHGKEIFDTARTCEVEIAFEAAVGGGIPIVGPLTHSLASNEITSLVGIVNGTTNYMLTRMSEEGLAYDEVLKIAQEKGYAESDPSADVDGFDAAAKIAILSSIAYSTNVNIDDVHTEGISSLTPADLAYAKEMDCTIKLLAIGRRVNGKIAVRVHPTMIPNKHPLASVRDVYNAIYVVGDAVGETMFFGEGAGSMPTASAVMGDVIEIARRLAAEQVALPAFTFSDELPLQDIDDLETSYYVRLVVADEPGVLAAVAQVFGAHGVSIASVVQKRALTDAAEIVYVTHHALEANMQGALEEIKNLDVVDTIAALVRVENLV